MNRHSTSERQVRDLRRPDRHTPMKMLVKKSYGFVERLWAAYLASNCSDLRYIFMRADLHCIHARMSPYYWSTTCRPLVEVGRDEDEELQQDGMVLEDVTAADDEDHDGDDGDEGE